MCWRWLITICALQIVVFGCDTVYSCRWILTFWRNWTMKIEMGCSCEMSVSTYKVTIGTITEKISEPLVGCKHQQICVWGSVVILFNAVFQGRGQCNRSTDTYACAHTHEQGRLLFVKDYAEILICDVLRKIWYNRCGLLNFIRKISISLNINSHSKMLQFSIRWSLQTWGSDKFVNWKIRKKKQRSILR